MLSGVMPCSRLYSSWRARRRFVSPIAAFIESVTWSAYRIAWPATLRAARPIVWISEPAERRKPSLSASRIGHQRHLGQVEPLAQQVDADQHVELALAQVAQDPHALERLDVGVQVAHAHAEVVVVLGQVLGHALGERRDQHALALRGAHADLREQVVHLALHRAHLDPGVDQAGGADHLLDHHAARLLQLVGPGRRRDVDHLAEPLLELLEAERPVVERRGQAEAVLDERLLALLVAVVHPAHLRDRLVRLVDHHQHVLRQVVEQRRRRLAGLAAGEVARVVLDAVAVAGLAQHLEVEHGALVEPLRLEQLARPSSAGFTSISSASIVLTAASSRGWGVT